MNEQGPVIDAIRELLRNIWAVLAAIVEFAKTIPDRIDAKLTHFEWVVFGSLLVFVVVHAVITRPRK